MRVSNTAGGPPTNVPSVEASGVRATKEAANRAARAAVDTTRAFHPAQTDSAASVTLSSESQDLAKATVELMGAKAEMKAGATLIRTGDEVAQETLHLLDRKR